MTTAQRKLEQFIKLRAAGKSVRFRRTDFPLHEGWREFLAAVEQAGALSDSSVPALRKRIEELERLVQERTDWALANDAEVKKARDYIQTLQRVLAEITSSKAYRLMDALGLIHSEPR